MLIAKIVFYSSIYFYAADLKKIASSSFDLSDPTLKLPCALQECRNISDGSYDVVVFIAASLESIGKLAPNLKSIFERQIELDKSTFDGKDVALISVDKQLIPSGRLILSTTGPLNRDFDDVRRFKDAAFSAIKKAKKIKANRILLVIDEFAKFQEAKLISVLAAMQGFYVPLQTREFEILSQKNLPKITLGVWFPGPVDNVKAANFLATAAAIESGKFVARDIIGADPERMAPPKAASYIKSQFQNSNVVTVEVIEDPAEILKNYPLVAAVNRAASHISRHLARIVKLNYNPGSGTANKTLLFVGKGITLDTGGLDVKMGGGMFGMSNDKSGAAIVAGFFKTLDALKPAHLQAAAILPFVRNSLGSEAYSCDEILLAKSGRRVRVVNTDAEGRMVMLDPLWEMGRLAVGKPDPHIFTVATLTGHAVRTVGLGYSISIDNGPARLADFSRKLVTSSEVTGEIIERSVLRREDYEFHKTGLEFEDLKQAGTLSSSQIPRGHMTPAAFLIMGSGLDKHGIDSENPLKFTHIDIAGSEPEYPDVPWGTPLTALVNHLIFSDTKI